MAEYIMRIRVTRKYKNRTTRTNISFGNPGQCAAAHVLLVLPCRTCAQPDL